MLPNTAFLKGNAYHSTLPEGQVDIVLERALIHHLNDLNACLKEANRIMKNVITSYSIHYTKLYDRVIQDSSAFLVE